MAANQCSWLEQRSVIKFLVTDKCKLYEINRKMYGVYADACFCKKKINKKKIS